MRLTLDTNCLRDLEEETAQTSAITQLIKLHRAGKIQVHVGAISASENLPGKVAPETVSQFEARLKKLGIDDLPSILPTGRNEMSFWGAAVYGAEKDDLGEKINSVVHSTVDTLTLTAKSRNALSDVDSLAAHIRSGHDIFVTSDEHFRKATRRQALVALGAKEILTPEEALSKVSQHTAAVEKR
jgi:hypothetical protein